MGRTRSIIAKPEAVVGLDVGQFSHWAYGIGAAGEVTADFPVENREGALDSFFASVEPGTLVVVDQVRDIGALAISRARLGRSSPSTTPRSFSRATPRPTPATPR